MFQNIPQNILDIYTDIFLNIRDILIIDTVYLNILEILGIDPEPGPQVSQISRRRIQLLNKALSFQ